jgi:hypothetical protein
MSLEGDIKKGADEALQKATGQTPPSLLSARFGRLQSFAGQELSKPQNRQPVETASQSRGVESQTTVVPTAPIQVVEPAAPIPSSGAPSVGSGTLVARYIDFTGGSPTTATGSFLKA